MTTHLGGQPAYVATDKDRKVVEAMIAYGIPQLEVARAIGIGLSTLTKYYRDEVDRAATQANAKVIGNLFKQATKDDFKAIPAAIFWAKTRLQWRETNRHEHVGSDGGPITTLNLAGATDGQLKLLEYFVSDAAGRSDDNPDADQGGNTKA
jgi:hypothetical protein